MLWGGYFTGSLDGEVSARPLLQHGLARFRARTAND